VAAVLKRCSCPRTRWRSCRHPWVVRYRTPGGRSGRQRERSFGQDKREAEDFALKVEHDKRARVFVDPKEGETLFRTYAEEWLGHRIIADSSSETYASVLRTHIYPAFGGKKLNTVRRQDIKNLVAAMRADGIGASRVHTAHLVINAIFNEAVRDGKLAESPCVDIELPDVTSAKDFVAPTHAQVEALAAGLPGDWEATVWIMQGCGLRIGEALALNTRCRVGDGKTLRITEQVNPTAQLRPLKFRKVGEYRDIPLPRYVADAIDKHLADHGACQDGYLFRGRKKKLVTRNTYREHFTTAVKAAGLPDGFVPHSLRHYFASLALSRGIPITDV
jgi:integrase